jgi:pSer/pThr/pTyr-binding forkhead associated (FHA) protein
MRAQLIPLDNGAPLEIADDMTLVGRGEGCDLRLDHKSVSKLHCVLVKTDGLILVRDLGSTNGTRVNGTRVRRAALLPDDLLSIASMKFRVLFGAKLAASVSPEEKTQQIQPEELERLRRKSAPDLEDSAADIALDPVVTNALPDVYPEDETRGKKE